VWNEKKCLVEALSRILIRAMIDAESVSEFVNSLATGCLGEFLLKEEG
jgi:hypothetical protein